MKLRLFSLVIILTLAAGLGQGASYAKSPNSLYSEATGHTISGPFLEYYLRAANPQEVYGQPITDAFTDLKTHSLIQYFEKARFEYHPYAKDGHTIQPTPLGHILFKSYRSEAVPADQVNNSTNCRVFPDTNFRVCMAFKTFYQENGAEHTFGPPISDAIYLDKYIVQYFFYAKLIWNSALPMGESIQVADLGYEYFFTNNEDPSRLEPQPNGKDSIIDGVVELKARAMPFYAVTQREGRQTVFIHVTDQRGYAHCWRSGSSDYKNAFRGTKSLYCQQADR